MNITPATLAALAKFDTPTISNTIELFDVVPRNRGYMDGRIQAAFSELPPMVGFAATAAFRSDALPSTGDAYGSMDQQIAKFADLPGPAVVVFQDLDDPSVADIMVNSFYDSQLDEGCAFEELISFHGGMGGPQTRPFVLYPVTLSEPTEPLVGAVSVHDLLLGWRRGLQGGE